MDMLPWSGATHLVGPDHTGRQQFERPAAYPSLGPGHPRSSRVEGGLGAMFARPSP